jgi:hypothetical protein
MDFQQELERLVDRYHAQGYRVVARPTPQDLPPFAKDFRVEIAARRGDEGILVAVKKNREDAAGDTGLGRYAEITGAQPGWRFDLVILEGESGFGRELRGSREFSNEDIDAALAEAEQIVRMGFIRAAVVAAWGALEAAMRIRLRASGERASRGTMPRVMMNELYSSGVLSSDEFRRLERMFQLRTEIAHGFSSPTPDAEDVRFLADVSRRLMAESQQQGSAA